MNRTVNKRALGENLKEVLHRTKFCTFCFDSDENLLNLDDEVIGDWEGEGLPVNEMLDVVFGNAGIDFLSKFICKACLSSAITSYIFITRSRKTVKLYSEYLSNLNSQISEVILCGDGEWGSSLIVLEYIDHTDNTITPKNVRLKYICDLCGKEYTGKGSLRKHISKHKSGVSEPIDCPRCQNRPCQHEKYLAAVDSQMSERKEVITCVDCSAPLKSTTHLIAHIQKKHLDVESITCQECGETFPSVRNFKVHCLYNHSSKFVCDVCFQFFGTDQDLKVHVTSCQKTSSSIEPKLSNSFVESADNHQPLDLPLKRSTKVKDVKRIKSKKKITMNEENKYHCLLCNKVFKSLKELKEHKRLHKDPNCCVYCNVTFDSRKEYIDHSQTLEHKRKMPYNSSRFSCKQCEYRAACRNSLVAHTNRVHLKIRPFKCEYCPCSYFSKVQFHVHLKTHTEQVKPIICDICGVSLKTLRSLKKHKLRHTGEKPFSCPHCDVKVTNLTSLKGHMSRHTDPTVQCPLCGSLFHTMRHARNHVRNVHWKSKEKFDYTKLEGLSPEDYHFFKDRRKAI